MPGLQGAWCGSLSRIEGGVVDHRCQREARRQRPALGKEDTGTLLVSWSARQEGCEKGDEGGERIKLAVLYSPRHLTVQRLQEDEVALGKECTGTLLASCGARQEGVE